MCRFQVVLKCIEMQMRSVSEVKGMTMPVELRDWLWIAYKVHTEYRKVACTVLKHRVRGPGNSVKINHRMLPIFLHR